MRNELLEMCLRMFQERSEHYFNEASKKTGMHENLIGRAIAYDSAYVMLKFALEENEECLRQFDYFNKED